MPLDPHMIKVEKLRRLDEEKLRFYEPHPKQLEFHKSQAEMRGLFGGNQSGKSYGGGMEMAWTIGKVHPHRPNCQGRTFARDCCVSFGVMQSVLIPTYKSILPRKPCRLEGETFEGQPRWWPGLRGGAWKTAWDKMDRIIHLEDGSFIEFKSYDQDVDTFAGPPRHIIRMDEEPPEKIYNENLARQITTGRNMLFTMTPLNYSQWLYTGIYERSATDPLIDCFMMSSVENPFADRKVLAAMEKDISDPIERAARLHGEFVYAKGRVWKEYGDHNLCDPFVIPRSYPRAVVIDPHLETPTAVSWFARDHEGRAIQYNEAEISGDVDHICQEITNRCAGQCIDLWLIDPSSRQSATIHGQGRLVDRFRKHFPSLILANNNRELGWDVVRYAVKNRPGYGPKALICRNCTITHFQMKNYSWKPPTATGEDRRKPEVYKKHDHFCDNWRYYLMATTAHANKTVIESALAGCW